MMNPKITVLMSVFNEQTYLREAVESVLSQTFGDFEFIIINDGSEEPFEDIISEYKDDRIRLFRQENMGLARSLNRGLRLARGDYIARMDADDVCRSDRFDLQIKEMEAHHQIDLLGSFFDVIDEKGELIETKELITDPIYRLWRLQFHNNYGHGAMMLKKQSVLRQGAYDETLLYAQDYDLWSRMSRKREYGHHSGSASIITGCSTKAGKRRSGTTMRNWLPPLISAIEICGPVTRASPKRIAWKFGRSTGSSRSPASLSEVLRPFRTPSKAFAVDMKSMPRIAEI